MASKAEKSKPVPLSNVETLPSHHIQGYEAAAEAFKNEVWNAAIDTIGEEMDMPVEWVSGILQSVALDLLMLDYEE